ncbi:MAG: LTA synthase family protein [Bacteroidota bacterium]
MKLILRSLILQFIFWIVLFDFSRIIFLLYYSGSLEGAGFSSIAGIFWYSLPLDVSTCCYFLGFPFLLLLFQSFYSPKWFNWINRIYTGILIFAYTLITTGELGIYQEWQTKMHYKGMLYMQNPDEVYNSAETKTFIVLLLLFIVQTGLAIFVYNKYVYKNIVKVKRNYFFSAAFLIITPVLIGVGLRGGIRQIPITQSQSYFSEFNVINLVSVNSAWNLGQSLTENMVYGDRNPFAQYPPAEVNQLMKDIHKVEKDTTISFLKTNRPNIVIIILESWSADLILSQGGAAGITPRFGELQREGVFFNNIYACGARSEQGMACIFSGFPAHPVSSITAQPSKYNKLPSLCRSLKNVGYNTSYYFGGQLIYGNIKGYIMSMGFQKIIEEADFDDRVIHGKLGVHDEFVLARQQDDLGKEKQPFLSALFTVSTHSPWDYPYTHVFNWAENEHKNNYINSAYYTDKCLGDYFARVKKEPWYNNTLFILLPDHSHDSYKNWDWASPEYHKIFMLFAGNVIKDEYRGTTVKTIGQQSDLPATLLHQLQLPSKDFIWSKNLMNPYTRQFGYYSFEEGVGWTCPEGFFVYDDKIEKERGSNLEPKAVKDSIIKTGRSYLQAVYQQYLDF